MAADGESNAALEGMDDLNVLQTALRAAVQREDYAAAAALRDRIDTLSPDGYTREDWRDLGLPEWLANRAERCGYSFPTSVQRAALAALLRDESDVLIQAQTGSGKTLAFLLPCLAALSESLFQVQMIRAQVGPQMLQPLALLLVPTRELGAQLALLAWRLLGGNLARKGPGDPANMFTYEGPRSVEVVGILDDNDVQRCRTDVEGGGLLEGVQIVIGVPKHVAQVVLNGDLPLELMRFIAVDELDLCMAQSPDAVQQLLTMPVDVNAVRQVALAGATLEGDLLQLCVERGWIVNAPRRVGEVHPGALGRALPPALTHRMVSLEESRKLLVLCQRVRREPDDAKLLVFCQTEPQALRAAERLRRALWGIHNVVVCVSGGFEPLKALEAFRDGKATMLLATVNSARGLDLQGVTHVYSLAPPANIAEYVHRAGRTGRIGNAAASSTVTTFASPALGEDVAMRNIAAALGVELLEEQDAPYATGKGDGDEGTGSLLDRLDEEGEEEETADDGAAAIPAEDNIASKDTERANRLTDLFQLMDAQGAPLLEQPAKEPLSLAEELLERELAQLPPEALTGELWERIEMSDAADSPFKANDVRKAKQCVKFVGDGCAGSSTDFYRRAAGDLGNCSSYLPGDRVYISVNGDREGRVRPVDAQGFLTGLYRDELLPAAAAGVSFMTDRETDRNNGYNVGELEIAVALQRECGYTEDRDDEGGTGVWRPPTGTAANPDVE